jgi:hypothetical protein
MAATRLAAGSSTTARRFPALRGKYIFTDLTTGRIWYANYADMLAADDGKPGTLAKIHEVRLLWNKKFYDSMFPIVEAAYHERGGTSPRLPVRADLIKQGRADVRFSIDADGELYLYSKGTGSFGLSSKRSGFEEHVGARAPSASQIASPDPVSGSPLASPRL